MGKIRFQLVTPLSPQVVLSVLTDFGERRAQIWPNIDRSHFKLHSNGPGWAEVTEGNVLAVERSRYEWGSTPDRVTVTTIESNTWGPGSRWEYRLTPSASGGTQIEAEVVRHGRGFRGRLLEPLVGLGGARLLRSQMAEALTRATAT